MIPTISSGKLSVKDSEQILSSVIKRIQLDSRYKVVIFDLETSKEDAESFFKQLYFKNIEIEIKNKDE